MVENQVVQQKKLRITKFIQKWKKKFFTANALVLPQPRKQCNFTSVTMVVQRYYVPANDLADCIFRYL